MQNLAAARSLPGSIEQVALKPCIQSTSLQALGPLPHEPGLSTSSTFTTAALLRAAITQTEGAQSGPHEQVTTITANAVMKEPCAQSDKHGKAIDSGRTAVAETRKKICK
jgi:hypothetical protein